MNCNLCGNPTTEQVTTRQITDRTCMVTTTFVCTACGAKQQHGELRMAETPPKGEDVLEED